MQVLFSILRILVFFAVASGISTLWSSAFILMMNIDSESALTFNIFTGLISSLFYLGGFIVARDTSIIILNVRHYTDYKSNIEKSIAILEETMSN